MKAASGVVALWALLALALMWPGALAITKHSGDALHMIAIVERLAHGQLPHLDFMTPIGVLAFWPIAALVGAWASVGQAFLAAQVLVGAVTGALAFTTALRRMPAVWAGGFAALTLVLATALVHGKAEIAVSVSMHYSRWAWALGFIVLMMAALPARKSARSDGVVTGGLMAALLLIKVAYFAALAPPLGSWGSWGSGAWSSGKCWLWRW